MSLFTRFENDNKISIELNEIQINARQNFLDGLKRGDYQEEECSCPVCEKSEVELISEKDRYAIPMNVGMCKSCGLGITSPRLNASSYKKFYNELYREFYLGVPVAQEDFFQDQKRRAKKIHRFIEEFGFIKGDNSKKLIVEIGCGAGGILDYFKSQGYVILGVDYGQEYVDYGRKTHNLNLVSGDISLLESQNIKADLVIYSHVVEHLMDLNKELESIKNILKPSGYLYVEVPGIKNIHQDYDCDYLVYMQNAHTYHFTKNTLSNILRKNQFNVLKSNEVVRSISRLNKTHIEYEINNDFESIKNYLIWLESELKPFNKGLRTLKKGLSKAIASLLKMLGLYDWVNQTLFKGQK